jgi:tRNA G46 methylase TrmB
MWQLAKEIELGNVEADNIKQLLERHGEGLLAEDWDELAEQVSRENTEESDTCISNMGNTPTTKKDIIPHKKIKERKAHNNCLRKTSNNRRKTKSLHCPQLDQLMD